MTSNTSLFLKKKLTIEAVVTYAFMCIFRDFVLTSIHYHKMRSGKNCQELRVYGTIMMMTLM